MVSVHFDSGIWALGAILSSVVAKIGIVWVRLSRHLANPTGVVHTEPHAWAEQWTDVRVVFKQRSLFDYYTYTDQDALLIDFGVLCRVEWPHMTPRQLQVSLSRSAPNLLDRRKSNATDVPMESGCSTEALAQAGFLAGFIAGILVYSHPA